MRPDYRLEYEDSVTPCSSGKNNDLSVISDIEGDVDGNLIEDKDDFHVSDDGQDETT